MFLDLELSTRSVNDRLNTFFKNKNIVLEEIQTQLDHNERFDSISGYLLIAQRNVKQFRRYI